MPPHQPSHELQEWGLYQRLVLERLDEQREALDDLRQAVHETRIEVAQLQVKSGVWGMIGGAVPILIALLFMLLSTGCWAVRGGGASGVGGAPGSATASSLTSWVTGSTRGVSGDCDSSSSGGSQGSGAAGGRAAVDPFWPIGLISILCLVAGVLLLLTRNLIEGAIALGTAIGLMMLRAFLQEAAPMLFLFGLAAAIFFLGQYWGDLKIRRQTRRGVEQFDPEERAQRPELRALEAIVRPWQRTPALALLSGASTAIHAGVRPRRATTNHANAAPETMIDGLTNTTLHTFAGESHPAEEHPDLPEPALQI